MHETHIFMDNSNIFGGAQNAAGAKEQVPWPAVRINYENLLRLLVYKKSNRRTSMLAGSVPPGNEALWTAAQQAGFDTTLLRKVESDTGNFVEQGVDEAIHLKIANMLLDAKTPGVMVLATGDGADTEQGSSFTKQVQRAAERGWKVEIWSWKRQLSSRLRDSRITYPNNVTVFKLDEWYRSIVFIKGGIYNFDGNDVTVKNRSCDDLNFTDSKFHDAST